MPFFSNYREKFKSGMSYNSAFLARRADAYTRRFSLYQSTGGEFAVEPVNDTELLECALNEPIAYRLTFVVGTDTVNCGFDFMKSEQPNEFHGRNNHIQTQFEKYNMIPVATHTYQLERIYGRAWMAKIDPIKYEKVTAEDTFYVAFSNPDLTTTTAHTWDQSKQFIPVEFNLRFTDKSGKIPIKVEPEDYHFVCTRPIHNHDEGVPVLRPCWNDLINLRIMRVAFTERVRKYGGFPHIKVIGATDPVLQAAQTKWGDFDELKEAWSNEETEIDMKGLEGVQLDPNKYLEPFIRQVSISSGYPMPILMGMESGQLKSGQINMSSVYAMLSNNQMGLQGLAEWMGKAVYPSLADSNPNWRLEFAISDIDKLAMRKIEIENAVALRPYISDDAFARMLKIDVGDIERQQIMSPFGQPFGQDGQKPFEKKDKGLSDNPITEGKGREFGDKKDKKLREMR